MQFSIDNILKKKESSTQKIGIGSNNHFVIFWQIVKSKLVTYNNRRLIPRDDEEKRSRKPVLSNVVVKYLKKGVDFRVAVSTTPTERLREWKKKASRVCRPESKALEGTGREGEVSPFRRRGHPTAAE